MAVPEAAVDEYDFAAGGKYQVRLPGKVFSVQAVAILVFPIFDLSSSGS